ncbi:MAG: hypothetical protein EOP54_15370 [Sphingobacteriales bacterium]|nr:MAG: hypothetical protein EOP54_15370 [Sphingobacteriales bacterium]
MGIFDGFKRVISKIGSGVKGVSNVVGGGIKKARQIAGKVKEVVRSIPGIGEDLARVGDEAVNMPIPFIGKSAKELADTTERYANIGRDIGGRMEAIR